MLRLMSETATPAEGFAQALSARLARRGAAAELARALEVSDQLVSNWRTGKDTPDPSRIFQIEEALKMKPGSLSHLLGYMPIKSGSIRTPEQAIEFDSTLTPAEQGYLIVQLREIREGRRSGPSDQS